MAAILIASGAAPATASAGSSNGPILESLVEGEPAISLGFDVSPLRGPADLDSRGTTISLDVKLKRPGAEAMTAVEPYLTLGPALFVVEPDYVGRLLGTRVDPTLRLGAKASAGLNWWLGKNTMLFGAYEATTAGHGDVTSLGAKAPADPGINGYGFTYGLRFRY